LGTAHDARGGRLKDDGQAPDELQLETRRLCCPPEHQEVTPVIHAGDTLANAVTGETIQFIETAADTDGEYTLIEVTVEAGGGVPMTHVHPYQSETFEVLEGELTMKAGRDRLVARAGDVVSVPPGESHVFRNESDRPVRFRCTVAPSRQFELFIETMFELAAAGKVGKRGMPGPLRLAPLALAYFDDVRAPVIPAWMQKAGLVPGAALARVVGVAPKAQQGELVPATA
jgi:quercetin dioxygenase-like cupin family protein